MVFSALSVPMSAQVTIEYIMPSETTIALQQRNGVFNEVCADVL
jgi:hypothetical protein